MRQKFGRLARCPTRHTLTIHRCVRTQPLAGINDATEIAATAAIFIFSAISVGCVLAVGMNRRDTPVVIFESGVRNVGVALILGGTILGGQEFGLFARFFRFYVAVEVVIMLTYARLIASQRRDELA